MPPAVHTDIQQAAPRGSMYRSKRNPWQLASPDMLAWSTAAPLDEFPVEAQTADANSAWMWGPDWSDIVPPYYRCQLVWYGDVLGATEGYIAVLIGGNDFRIRNYRE